MAAFLYSTHSRFLSRLTVMTTLTNDNGDGSDGLGPDGTGVGTRGGCEAEDETVGSSRARLGEAFQLFQG